MRVVYFMGQDGHLKVFSSTMSVGHQLDSTSGGDSAWEGWRGSSLLLLVLLGDLYHCLLGKEDRMLRDEAKLPL